MAARKRVKGPKVITYILTVNAQTGEVLESHVEHPVTGERTKIKGNLVPTAVVIGPPDPLGPVILGSVTRKPITPTSLMRVPSPEPPPDWRKAGMKAKAKRAKTKK